jgi:hypothetical protein
MDAVGWALINNDPITCTVRHVTTDVDAGAVLATRRTPLAPLGGLKERVKAGQLQLLLSVATQTATAGRAPDGITQDHIRARQFYRLHPHLKRLLDSSPYSNQPTFTTHGATR